MHLEMLCAQSLTLKLTLRIHWNKQCAASIDSGAVSLLPLYLLPLRLRPFIEEDESSVRATTLLLLTTVLEDKLLGWPAENALMHYLQARDRK